MFEFANPVTFKYFVPFIYFYSGIIVLSFVFRIVLRYLPKETRKAVRKSFSSFFDACFWIGLLGLMYLGARKYNVYFLSMEFLHVVNLAVLLVFKLVGLKKYLQLSKQK